MHSVYSDREGLLPECSVGEVEAHMATYSLFTTDQQREVSHRQLQISIITVVEVASGIKGHA